MSATGEVGVRVRVWGIVRGWERVKVGFRCLLRVRVWGIGSKLMTEKTLTLTRCEQFQ